MKRVKLTDIEGNERGLYIGDNTPIFEMNTTQITFAPFNEKSIVGLVDEFNSNISDESKIEYRSTDRFDRFSKLGIIHKQNNPHESLLLEHDPSLRGIYKNLPKREITLIPSLGTTEKPFMVIQTQDEIFEALNKGVEDLHSTVGLERFAEWRSEAVKPLKIVMKNRFSAPEHKP